MSDDLVKRWDDYVESMGCVMGEVEHTAQQMRDRIEELELAVRYEADLAQQALDAREELETKLAKAVEALDEAVYLLAPDDKDMARKAGVYRVVTTLAAVAEPHKLKGQDDEVNKNY